MQHGTTPESNMKQRLLIQIVRRVRIWHLTLFSYFPFRKVCNVEGKTQQLDIHQTNDFQSILFMFDLLQDRIQTRFQTIIVKIYTRIETPPIGMARTYITYTWTPGRGVPLTHPGKNLYFFSFSPTWFFLSFSLPPPPRLPSNKLWATWSASHNHWHAQ